MGRAPGLRNESYLNADALAALFLEPLEPYRRPRRCADFRIRRARRQPARVRRPRWIRFLARLPQTFRYAVEVRNREYLQPRYFDCLRAARRRARLQFLDAHAAARRADRRCRSVHRGFTVVRALLRQGRAYEDAVAQFTPYDQVRDENPEAREALRELIRRMREERRAAYIFVNNRLEGNAPETIRAVDQKPNEASHRRSAAARLSRLAAARNLVIEAPPGAGKTTRVPPALLARERGEVLVLEPRRLAARMAARRVASELGERVGETVGYQVRFEDVSGPRTRLRFLTEGVLTRRLLSDPTAGRRRHGHPGRIS